MRNKLLLFVFSALLFWTCKKNDATVQEAPAPKVTTTITGIVTNETGQFLQGVNVSVGDKSVITDKEGLFLFENIEVLEARFYVKATLNNYFESGSGGIAVKDGVTTLQIKLMSMGTPKDVSATAGSTNNIGGATLKFDAGSFVNQSGNAVTSGTVRVYVRSLNPDNPDFSDLVPGGDLSSTMPDGSPATLESYGMVGVELRDANNNELKLASGKQAEIRFPIASSQLSIAPAEIPLLSMDPETGEWKQEGVATKVGSEYVGKVGHFSWWNCDVARFNSRIRGRVVDCENRPLAGVTVIVNGQYSRITDADGYYEGLVPRRALNFQVKILGLTQTLANVVNLPSPAEGLNTLPDIKVGALGNCPTYVTGTISRCGSNKNFYIRAIWGNNNIEGALPTLLKADSFRLLVPQAKNLIIRISYGLFVRDTIINAISGGTILDIGQLSGCVSIPSIRTLNIDSVTATSTLAGGEVISNGGAPVVSRGIVWSTNPNPTISLSTKTIDGSGMGIFSSNLSPLIKNTLYYMRAYATNSAGTNYGDQLIFRAGLDPYIFNSLLNYGEMSDIDGNVYKTIQIGSQTWMAENLRVTRFRDGTAIPNITDNAQWTGLTTPAWCYYNNDLSYNKIYGKLYNWNTANDPRGLAPQGWHIPSNAELAILENYLGGANIAGGKMKSAGLKYWVEPNLGATNTSGFSAIPGGYRRFDNGLFYSLGLEGAWWSSTPNTSGSAFGMVLIFSNGGSLINGYNRIRGFSVRCIKD